MAAHTAIWRTARAAALLASLATGAAAPSEATQQERGTAATARLPERADELGAQLSDSTFWRREFVHDLLPPFRLRNLTVDAAGVPWLAHDEGVLAYDGLEWRQVGIPPLEPGEHILSIAPGGPGVLLATSRRVFVGNDAGLEILPLQFDGDVIPRSAVAEPRGPVLVDALVDTGVRRRVLLRVEAGVASEVELPSPLAQEGMPGIWRTRSGTLWTNTEAGLMSEAEGVWTVRLAAPEGENLAVSALHENLHGDGLLEIREPVSVRGLWSWAAHGPLQRDPEMAHGFARALDVHDSGSAVVFYDSGRAVLRKHVTDPRSEEFIGPPRQITTATTLLFDDRGGLWAVAPEMVGSFDPGRHLWTRWEATGDGLAARVHAILPRADGSTWLATADGLRIHRPDETVESITAIDGVALGTVTGLAEDRRGRVWIASGSAFRGFYVLEPEGWRRVGSPNPDQEAYFHRIVPDRNGRLWFLGLRRTRHVATDDPGAGAWRIDDGEPLRWAESDRLPSGQIYDMHDSGDALWFATMRGLARLRDGQWTIWDENRLRYARIVAVSVDDDGRAWFSDGQQGIGTIDPDGGVRYLGGREDLPMQGVRDILVDGRRLWLAGDDGVGLLSDGVFARPFTKETDPSTAAWPLLRHGDRLLVGSQGLGVLELDISAATGTPAVRITDLVVEPDLAMVHWSVRSAGALIPEELVESRYRVDDGPWSAWGKRTEARLAKLPPGEHRVSVQSKGLLAETSEPVTRTFVIPLPLLRDPTFWFPVLGVVAALLAAGTWLYYRRHEQRERLRRSEARYRTLFESASDVIVTRDLDGKITSVNRAGLELTGYSPEEAAELSIDQLMTADSLRSAESMLRAKMQGEDHTVYEAEIVARNGDTIPVELSSQLIYEEGRVVGAQAFLRDIRARKKAEESLRNIAMGISATTGGDFFRSLVESLARELEMDYCFVAVPEPEVGLGEAVTEAPRRLRTVAVWGRGEMLENLEYDLRGTPCERVTVTGVCSFTTGVQALFPEDSMLGELEVDSYIGTPLRDSSGDLLGIMVAMDREAVRSERLARSMLQIFAIRAAAELEKIRAEDALRRTEEELRQAQKMEAIGRLAGSIAHDFNNLLTVVNGYTDIALSTMSGDEPLAEDLRQVAAAGRNAKRLTGQLLAFSRRQALDVVQIAPSEAVRALRPLLERLLRPGHRLVLEVEDVDGCVMLGSGQLEQVLMNLVSNAVDATPQQGTVVVRCRASDSDDGGQPRVLLEVEDDGTGMAPTTRTRVFEPFFTTKEPGVGTGLGLSTVYGIVRQSEGTIELDSEEGRGTRVSIVWPLVESEIGLADVPAAEAGASGSGRILVVEDQDMVRSFVERALGRLGYAVVGATSAVEALAYLDDGEPVDLVLTDVLMPGMDGVELARRVREQHPGARVLLMSGYAERTLPTGPDAPPLLQKPFTPQELGMRVQDLLDRQPGG